MIENLTFSVDDLRKEVDAGYVSIRPHPEEKLFIFNYTAKAQYNQHWNEVTKNCRGLILDDDYKIVARPFGKIFNYSEVIPDKIIYDQSPIIHDKLDGCFHKLTKLNLWGGGTIKISDVVNKKLSPTLIGRDADGNLVPSKVIDWHDNGIKSNWIKVTVDCPVSLKSGMGKFQNNITVTTNHEVVANAQWVTAGDLMVGDKMVTYEKTVDENCLHVLRSGLLGDGSLSPAHGAFRYQEAHSVNQWTYTDYINRWIGGHYLKPRYTMSGYGSKMKWAQSVTLKSLASLRQEWYPDGVKVVPEDLSWIDDFSVAKWYMDDGALAHSEFQKDRATFATDSFTKKDVIRLGEKLKEMYGISYSLQPSKKEGNFTLRVNAGQNGKQSSEIDNFWTAIAPHIIPEYNIKLLSLRDLITNLNPSLSL